MGQAKARKAEIDAMKNGVYQDGINRSADRVKRNGEVFTPTALVNEMLDKLDKHGWIGKDTLDPCCGNGQFLVEALRRKIKAGMQGFQALQEIYGIELMRDNVVVTRNRLVEIAMNSAVFIDPTLNPAIKTNRDLIEKHLKDYCEINNCTEKDVPIVIGFSKEKMQDLCYSIVSRNIQCGNALTHGFKTDGSFGPISK